MILQRSIAEPVEVFPGLVRRTLIHGPSLMLVEFTIEAGTDLPVHTHPHEQAGYVVSGRLRLHIENRSYDLAGGDCYYALPNQPHGATTCERSVVVDSFTPPRQDYLSATSDFTGIRICTVADSQAIHAIINDAAEAYRGIIPADCWHEPYMSREELRQQINDGVVFYGYALNGELIGVMGLQYVNDVALIRHAYVRTVHRQGGVGGRLLSHLRGLTDRPILIGTWAAATWAIAFYQKHAFRLVTSEEKDRLLRKYWRIPDRQIETSVVLRDR